MAALRSPPFFHSQLLLAILNFANGLLGKGFLVLGTGSFHLTNVIEGHTFNSALLLEDLLLLLFIGIGLLEFFMKPAPGRGPSESLGL